MIKTLSKFFRVWTKGFSLSMSSEMAYKASFIMTVIAIFIQDMVGPILSYLIYTVSPGIPGWSLTEFILFQGTILLVFGFWHAFLGGISWYTADLAAEGDFDTALLKPFPSLGYIAAQSIDFHGIAEIFVGAVLVIWTVIKLNLFGWLLLPYLLLVILAVVFAFSISLILASLSIIFVRVYALQNLIGILIDISSYPVTIYSTSMQFFLTFIVPTAIAAYWPVSVLLGKVPITSLATAILPVIVFLAFSFWFWNFSLKRYQSGGG